MTSPYRDQASELRSLISETRTAAAAPKTQAAAAGGRQRRTRTIAITSGKGGVGKSVLALNLAISLAQQQQRVCLLDADFGTGSLHLLCGLTSSGNLTDVVERSRSLQEITLTGPEGISIIPGAAELTDIASQNQTAYDQLIQQFAQLETEYDVLIADCGTGLHRSTRQFAAAADTVVLVTTLEITSLADTYAALKSYQAAGLTDVRVCINQATPQSAQQAIQNLRTTAQQFLKTEVSFLGCVPHDPVVPASVAQRKPLMQTERNHPLGRTISHLTKLLIEPTGSITPISLPTPYIKRLQATDTQAAA